MSHTCSTPPHRTLSTMKHLVPLLSLALLALSFAACDTASVESADGPGESAAAIAGEEAVLAKQEKVGICHWSEDEGIFIPISIAAPAVDKHIANHGDFLSYNDSCECPCFSGDDLTFEFGISSGHLCGGGNSPDGARIAFRHSGVIQPPYQGLSESEGGPSCTSPGTGELSGFAPQLATMCIDLVLEACD